MLLGFPLLNMGVTLVFFQSVGTTLSAMDALMIFISGLAISSAESLNRRGDMLSNPADLLVFNILSLVRVNCSVISFSSYFSSYFNNIVQELWVEDTQRYKEMLRMMHKQFLVILSAIEPAISKKQVNGGNKVIMPAERLTFTICFLGLARHSAP